MIEGQPLIGNENYPPPPPKFTQPNCTTTDPEIFFPKSPKELAADRSAGVNPREARLPYRMEGSRVIRPVETAKALCMECTHLVPCRNYAVFNHVEYGIWGGTTYKERLLLNRLLTAVSEVVEAVAEEFNGETA